MEKMLYFHRNNLGTISGTRFIDIKQYYYNKPKSLIRVSLHVDVIDVFLVNLSSHIAFC